MTTVADAVTTMRERLDEVNASQWTDIQLRRWLNEAIQDIARRTFHYTDVQTIAVAGIGESTYAVATDVIRINHCYWTPTGQTQYTPMQARQWDGMDNLWYDRQNQSNGGFPCIYSVIGYSPNLLLKLYPVPSQAGALHIHVARMPAAINVSGGGGSVDAPPAWFSLCLDYAEAYALRKDHDERWKDAMGLYEQKLGDMINNGDYLNAPNEFTFDGPYAFDRWLVEPGF